METETALATRPTNVLSKAGQMTAEDVLTLRKTLCRELNDTQFSVFSQVVGRTQLDPFSRQIYAIVRFDKRLNEKVMTIQTGIDGYRLIAQRTGEYAGQAGPYWCGPDGVWKDVWLSSTNPAAAKVGVLRKGFTEPVWGVTSMAEYFSEIGMMWRNMPSNQLAKCAEAQALRKAFPAELSHMYTTEEMEQADRPARSQMAEGTAPMTAAQRIAASKPAATAPATIDVEATVSEPDTIPEESPDAWHARITEAAKGRGWTFSHLNTILKRWSDHCKIQSYLTANNVERALFERGLESGKYDPVPSP